MTIRELKDKVAMVIVTESITDQVARGHQIINEDDVAESIAELFQSHLRESLGRVKSRFDFVPLPDDGTSSKEKIIIAQTNMLIGFFHQAIDTELKGLGGKE